MAQKKVERKSNLISKLLGLFDTHSQLIIVDFKSLKASKIDKFRRAIDQYGTLVMGKNSLIAKAIRLRLGDPGRPACPQLSEIVPLLTGN
jgi:ribosomal protein L10